MQATWSYLQNPFDNVTKKSHKRMIVIATDHHDRLLANKSRHNSLNALYNDFLPLYQAYTELYSKISVNSAFYKGNTQSVEDLLLELRVKKSARWEAMILSIYDAGSPNYLRLLPTGRKAFYEGNYESRISEVRSFVARLDLFPDLATVRTDAEQFLSVILTARTEQQGTEGIASQLSTDLENARIALSLRLHYHFAVLLSLYYNDTARVEDFFQLEYLKARPRNIQEDISDDTITETEQISISASGRVTVLENTITTGDEVRILNDGRTSVTAFSGNKINDDTPASGAYTIESLQSVVLTVGQGHGLIIIENDSSTDKASVTVEVL